MAQLQFRVSDSIIPVLHPRNSRTCGSSYDEHCIDEADLITCHAIQNEDQSYIHVQKPAKIETIHINYPTAWYGIGFDNV